MTVLTHGVREVRLRAAAVRAADVDADARVRRRRPPRLHRGGRRRGARVEALRRGRRRGRRLRRRARREQHAPDRRRGSERALHGVTTWNDSQDLLRGGGGVLERHRDREARQSGARRGVGSRRRAPGSTSTARPFDPGTPTSAVPRVRRAVERLDQHGRGVTVDRGRALHVGARMTEVHRVHVEAHAGARVGLEVVDRPIRRAR